MILRLHHPKERCWDCCLHSSSLVRRGLYIWVSQEPYVLLSTATLLKPLLQPQSLSQQLQDLIRQRQVCSHGHLRIQQ